MTIEPHQGFIAGQGVFVPIHDLRELAEELGVRDEELLKRLSQLTKHYYASRYPDAARRLGIEYGREVAEECVEIVKRVWRVLRRCLSEA